MITIIGGGLAGCEAAWQAASRGVPVTLHEMRPGAADRRAPDRPARRAGLQQFLPRRQARQRRRPPEGGDAAARLARDARGRGEPRAGRRRAGGRSRARSRETVTEALCGASARSRSCRDEVAADSRRRGDRAPVIIATGPLTSEALSAESRGSSAATPVLLRRDQPDRARRDDRLGRRCSGIAVGPELRGPVPRSRRVLTRGRVRPALRLDDGEGDYLNCPLTRDEYERFYEALVARGVGDGARLRQGDVLRGLPADRGDGASRRATRCGSAR